MDLTPYAEHLRAELLVAAEAGGEEARALAARLVAPLESAVRLTLLDALSAAADEITRESAPGAVELRLRAGQPEFVVTPAPAAVDADDDVTVAPPAAIAPTPGDDDGATARISLRVPEHLKAAIDDAAARDGVSVNTWLVRAASAAVSIPPPNAAQQPRPRPRGGGFGGDAFTGWVR